MGVSELPRWRDRFEAEGAEGLYDRRLGRLSARRAPVDEVARVLELFDTRYRQALPREAGGGARLRAATTGCALQAYGRSASGAQARRAPAQAPAPCAPRHDDQDGSRLEWLPGPAGARPDRHHGRRHERNLLGLLRRRRGHDVELPGAFRGDRGARAVLLALCRPASHSGTRPRPAARWTRTTTQVARASAPRHRADPGLFARARGRSERMQKRLPQELRLAGITGHGDEASFLKEVAPTQRPLRAPGRGRRLGLRLLPGALDDILCG